MKHIKPLSIAGGIAAVAAVAVGIAAETSASGSQLSPEAALVSQLGASATFRGVGVPASAIGLTAAQKSYLDGATTALGGKLGTLQSYASSADGSFSAALGTQGGCIVTSDGGGACALTPQLNVGDLILLEFDKPDIHVAPGQDSSAVVAAMPHPGTPYPVTIRGVAPDGFATAEGTTSDGSVVTSQIKDNTYKLHGTFTGVRLLPSDGGTALDVGTRWFKAKG